MADHISLNLLLDYENLQYKVSAVYKDSTFPTVNLAGEIQESQGLVSQATIDAVMGSVGVTEDAVTTSHIPYTIFDGDGVIFSAGIISGQETWGDRAFGSTTTPFGLNNLGGYGYDRNTQSGYLFSTNPYAQVRIDHNLDPAQYDVIPWLSGAIEDYFVDTTSILNKSSNKYLKTPIQLGRGEASLNAKVTAQSNNRITWSNTLLITQVGATDFTNAKVSVLSGTESGNSFRVVSYDNTNKYLYLDKSGSLVDSIIEVSPRSEVVSYSGWTDSTRTESRFGLSSPIPVGIGNYSGVITYSGQSTYIIGEDINILTDTALLPKDIYMRSPEYGDLITFTTALGAIHSGLVVDCHTTATQYGIKYYPRQEPGATAPNNVFTLKRSPKFNLELYPQFGKTYTVVSYGTSSTPWFGSASTQAPHATLEISAGDYDSAFGTVTNTSHFHIGPITLSDGTVLSGTNVLISGSLYNNNPTSNVFLNSWNRFTSASTNVAPVYSGLYSKYGSLVATYSNSFTTPDMLTLIASAKIGSATVNRTVNFPVQPPV